MLFTYFCVCVHWNKIKTDVKRKIRKSVWNKLNSTSREPTGFLERPPHCFQGNRAPNSPVPSLPLSTSFSLSRSCVFFLAVLGRREMWMRLALTSLPWRWRAWGEGRRLGICYWSSRDEESRPEHLYLKKNTREISEIFNSGHLFLKNPLLPPACPPFNRDPASFVSPSLPAVLCLSWFPLLLACCTQPPLSEEWVFHWWITLSHVKRMFRHAKAEYLLWCWSTHALLLCRGARMKMNANVWFHSQNSQVPHFLNLSKSVRIF